MIRWTAIFVLAGVGPLVVASLFTQSVVILCSIAAVTGYGSARLASWDQRWREARRVLPAAALTSPAPTEETR